MEKRGIILAGGSGSRLYPTTLGISKQLINIYDKPLIYYPLCTLMDMGVKDILIISTPQDTGNISRLLGSGHRWGIHLSYTVQDKPAGIAQAFILGKNFIGKNSISLILGDNVFTGLKIAPPVVGDSFRARIYIKSVNNPKAFGVYDKKNKCMVEKPETPPSNKISTGLYEFPPDVVHYTTFLKPSKRGELEIADLINIYLKQDRCDVEDIRETFWKDCGTPINVLDTSRHISNLQSNSTLVGSPEETALRNNYINDSQFVELVRSQYGEVDSNYSSYLKLLVDICLKKKKSKS